MPSVYDPVNVLRCERAFRFAGYGGDLQGVPDRLGKMEVDLLPLAGPSPGWGVSRPVQDIRKEGQLLQNAVALFLKPFPRVQAGTRGYRNRCFLFSVFHGDTYIFFRKKRW